MKTSLDHTTMDLVARLEATYFSLRDGMACDPVAASLLGGASSDLDTYVRLLKQSYHYVCRTSPWLTRASQRSANPVLARLLARKATEETGHEGWILADLEALGCDVTNPGGWPPSGAVAAYIAWHDFAVEACAEAILGAAYILERLSENAVVLAQHLEAAGVSPGGSSFMRGHGEVDEAHVREIERALGAIDDERAIAHIQLSALVTVEAYLGLLRSVAKSEERG